MKYYEVAPNRIIRADCDSFTYTSPESIEIGQVVTIEIGKKTVNGVVIKETTKPEYDTKEIISIVEKHPLPIQLVKLARWISLYYETPLATVLQTILPSGLNKKRRPVKNEIKITKRNRTNILFNKEQQAAIDFLDRENCGTFLLQGVTGSGKTEIYIDLIKKALQKNRSSIVVVPEIALTSQIISELSNHFPNLVLSHSRMTESSRHSVWQQSLNSTKPQVVVGPRSVLFMPVDDIGVIIIDEAHEPSLKQDQSPKYSALRVASVLGGLHKAKVVFGSATPSITDRYLSDVSNRPVLRLTKRAKLDSKPPTTSVIDMIRKENFKKHRFISDKLIAQIEKNLDSKEQVLIFHNRRGSASVTLCSECGWQAKCPKCFLPLTLHSDNHKMICHICGHSDKVPTKCPDCGKTEVIHKGVGTKLIEAELRKLFPKARILRFDADNKKQDTLDANYENIYNGNVDIIIGTQVVAKGLDLPHLRTVGIIQADSGLSLPDFGANERTFQLIAQVVGRVGRNEHETNVIVQTYKPSHPSIICGTKQDYESFYQNELTERKLGKYPPFSHLLKLTCVYKTEAAAVRNAKNLARELRNKVHKDVQIFGPSPSFYERQHDTYRWQLVLKSPKREHLITASKLVPTSHWQTELDPNSLL